MKRVFIIFGILLLIISLTDSLMAGSPYWRKLRQEKNKMITPGKLVPQHNPADPRYRIAKRRSCWDINQDGWITPKEREIITKRGGNCKYKINRAEPIKNKYINSNFK